MSHMMHVVHPEVVKGAGIVCGGPYGFDWVGYLEENIPEDRIDLSFALVEENEKKGLIDPVIKMKDSPAVVVSGSLDRVIPPIL